MIRDPITQVEAAEPPISKVQMHLFAEPTLRPDAEAIADQQHTDQKFGIDGWPPRVAVELREVGTDFGQINKTVDGAQQVVLRDVILN